MPPKWAGPLIKGLARPDEARRSEVKRGEVKVGKAVLDLDKREKEKGRSVTKGSRSHGAQAQEGYENG